MLHERSAGVYVDIEKLIKENARHAQNQAEYQEWYADLAVRYESLKSRLTALEDEKKSKLLRHQKIVAFVENLQEQNTILNEFDDGIFRAIRIASDNVCYTKLLRCSMGRPAAKGGIPQFVGAG